jgi:hypothetical protein
LDGRIPEEEWKRKKVNYSFLKNFGCEAIVHIDKENRIKIESNPRSVPLLDTVLMIFVIAYGIMKIKKIIRSRDGIFNEKAMYKYHLQGNKQEEEKQEYTVLDEITEKEITKEPENQNAKQQE